MLEESNGLNDILLDKSSNNSSTKKVVLAVAVLLIVAIIVIILMKSLSSNQSDNASNLPQVKLPPEPKESVVDDPLFEPVDVIDEDTKDDTNLDKIAQKLKQESFEDSEKAPEVEQDSIAASKATSKKTKDEAIEQAVAPQPTTEKPKAVVQPKPKVPASTSTQEQVSTTLGVKMYVQVGSFSKQEPDNKFLKKITDIGYRYMYHNVVINGKSVNKILVGPFKSEREAREALGDIKTKIIPTAFITKV
jgi:DedD protein